MSRNEDTNRQRYTKKERNSRKQSYQQKQSKRTQGPKSGTETNTTHPANDSREHVHLHVLDSANASLHIINTTGLAGGKPSTGNRPAWFGKDKRAAGAQIETPSAKYQGPQPALSST
jgi:hypothetical protein